MRVLSPISLEILKNSHATLKWVWTVVMALALTKSIETFIHYIDPITGDQILRDWQHFDTKDVMIFIAFIITAIRFHHGDSRYLDKTYLESQMQKSDPKMHSSKFRIFETYILLFHAITIYALAISQRTFPYFFNTYLILLCLNIFWLMTVCIRTSTIEENKKPRNWLLDSISKLIACFRTSVKEEIKYLRRWMINNSAHVVLLVVLYVMSHRLEASYSYIVFFVLVLLNTVIDYTFTWPYYFPKIPDDDTTTVDTNASE